MIWTSLAIAVAIAVILGLGGGILFAARRVRRARQVMESFAARYGLPYETGDGPAEMTISGEVEGRELVITTRDTHRSSSKHRAAPVAPHTSFRAPVDLGALDALSCRPDHIGAVDRGLTLGRPPLDDPYIFDGRPQHLALAFLSRDAVGETLERLHEAVPGARMVRGELDAEREGYPDDVEELEAIADPMVACAETLSAEASQFDPSALDTTPPANLDDFDDERRGLVEAWADVAGNRDLACVAAEPTGDVAIGGRLADRQLSIGTRGSAERDEEPHALFEIDAGLETRPTLVVKPTDSDWRLIGLHDDPVPIDADEHQVDHADLDDTYTFFADDTGRADLLETADILEAIDALVSPDRVIDVDDGVLRIEFERAPRTTAQLNDLIDRGVTLADRIDAATSDSEEA
ncbi:MAG: hypothetical protein ABEN55_01320 [Bradymonadaceae bacterium]